MSRTDAPFAPAADAPQTDPGYRVNLPEFFGPLDLLLSLIEQEDLEITTISLARVTDQYLAYLNSLPHVTPDTLTEFLVVAAKLLLIKSQVLLPRPPPGALIETEEDSADDLVQQLKTYKRFKQLAAELGLLQARGRRSFVRVAPPPKIEPRLTPGQLTIDDLLAAVRQALAVQPEPPGVGSVVSREVITIGGQITAIRTRLASGRPVRFTRLLSRTPSRIEIIVTLLAVLELIKRRVIDVEQAEAFGEINITPVDISLSDDDWEALSQLEEIS